MLGDDVHVSFVFSRCFGRHIAFLVSDKMVLSICHFVTLHFDHWLKRLWDSANNSTICILNVVCNRYTLCCFPSTGRLSPMQQASVAASASSSLVHQLHQATGVASPSVDQRIEGINDWLLMQQRAQRQDAAQLQQVQSYLRVAAVHHHQQQQQQQQQQHLQQARAAIMAASTFGPCFTSQSSSPTPLISDQGTPLPFGFQTGHQQQSKYHAGLQHQQQHFQRQTQPPSGKKASQTGYPDSGMMSAGNDTSSSSGALDTMMSYSSASSSALNLAEVDWSFDVGSLVADGGTETQTSASGYGAGQGLQHLLLAN